MPAQQQAARSAKRWLKIGARLGHLAKGTVYVLIGVLALREAFGSGGQVGGGKEAVRYLGSQTFGEVMLVAIGVGLLGYAAWRFVMAVGDTERDGTDARGVAKRLGYAGSGVVNGAVAITALQMALGAADDSGGTKTWVAKAMAQPFGQVLVGVLGLTIVGVGVHQLYSAYSKRFLEHLDTAAMSAHVKDVITRLGEVGYTARGVVFPIIGITLVTAAINHNPAEAKGLGEALRSIATSTFGQVMLVVVAAGLLAYGAFTIAIAKYRRVRVDSR